MLLPGGVKSLRSPSHSVQTPDIVQLVQFRPQPATRHEHKLWYSSETVLFPLTWNKLGVGRLKFQSEILMIEKQFFRESFSTGAYKTVQLSLCFKQEIYYFIIYFIYLFHSKNKGTLFTIRVNQKPRCQYPNQVSDKRITFTSLSSDVLKPLITKTAQHII